MSEVKEVNDNKELQCSSLKKAESKVITIRKNVINHSEIKVLQPLKSNQNNTIVTSNFNTSVSFSKSKLSQFSNKKGNCNYIQTNRNLSAFSKSPKLNKENISQDYKNITDTKKPVSNFDNFKSLALSIRAFETSNLGKRNPDENLLMLSSLQKKLKVDDQNDIDNKSIMYNTEKKGNFRARPMPNFSKSPIKIKRSEKKVITAIGPRMNADERIKSKKLIQSVKKDYTMSITVSNLLLGNKVKTPNRDLREMQNNNFNRTISPIADFNFDAEEDRFSFFKRDNFSENDSDYENAPKSQFCTKKSTKPQTEPIGFRLSTSVRAVQRINLEYDRKMKHKQKEENMKVETQLKKRKEQEEIRTLRRKLQFRAHPVKILPKTN